MDHGRVMRRHELSDAEWEFVRQLLPESLRGRKRLDDRTVLNGIVWKFRTGTAWGDVPDRQGPWATLHIGFRRWVLDGMFERMLGAVQARALRWPRRVGPSRPVAACRPPTADERLFSDRSVRGRMRVGLRDGQGPGCHGFEYVAQVLAEGGEPVSDAWGYFGIRGAGDDPVRLEPAQPAGQGVGADTGQGLAEFGEAVGTVQEFTHDQGGPGPVEQREEPGDTALGERNSNQFSSRSNSAVEVTGAPCALIRS